MKGSLPCGRGVVFPDLPAENAEDEVEHEEGAEDDEGVEEHPVRGTPLGVVGLQRQGQHIYLTFQTRSI